MKEVELCFRITAEDAERIRSFFSGDVSKKTAETDAIFENVRQINALADADTATMRISVDTKATVIIWPSSKGVWKMKEEKLNLP